MENEANPQNIESSVGRGRGLKTVLISAAGVALTLIANNMGVSIPQEVIPPAIGAAITANSFASFQPTNAGLLSVGALGVISSIFPDQLPPLIVGAVLGTIPTGYELLTKSSNPDKK